MPLDIKYIYASDDYYLGREIVCTKLSEATARVVSLPEKLEIRFARLGQSVYGNTAIDFRFKNRISLNTSLSVVELPEVLVHELLHVSQIHTGILSASRDGAYCWKNERFVMSTMTHAEYQALPWEQDVTNRIRQVMKDVLAEALKM